MKERFLLSISGLTLLGLVLCCSARAQTWKELLDRADSLHEAAAYDSAILVGNLAFEKAEKEFGKNDTTVASVLDLLGECYLGQGNYTEADSILSRSLALKTGAVGSDHPALAHTLANLARLSDRQGKYLEAEALYSQALGISKKTLGSDHADVALNLNGLANVYRKRGKYAEAESLYRSALAIRERVLGPDHPMVVNILENIAILYTTQGRYTEAEPLFERTRNVKERVLGPDHPDFARTLMNLAAFYRDQGKYAEVEPLYKQTLGILESTLGPDHPRVAMCLNNLANLYEIQNKYLEAESLHKRALAIREKTLGHDHPSIAESLNNLGVLFVSQGKYKEAESLYKRALATREKVLGPDHKGVADILNNLALIYFYQSKSAEAEALYKRALAIWEKTLGPDHPRVATGLNNLANLYLRQNKYTEAETLYKQALVIRQKALGPLHPNVAYSLEGLAYLSRNQGNYDEAESVYKRTLAIWEKALGTEHPSVARVLGDWALLLRDTGRLADSQTKERTALRIRRKNFRDGSAVLSERDALTYSKFMRDEANQYISILLDSEDTSTSCLKEMAEVVFSTKGQVSDGIFARNRTKVYEKDPNLKALSDSLRYARFRLANLYVQGPDEEHPEGYKEELDRLSKEKERLEAELARQSADFRRDLELWEVDAQKVAGAVPPRSILVEYLEYDRLTTGRETEPHYLLVVVDNRVNISVSDIGSSIEIDSLVALYRSHFQEISKGGAPFTKDLERYKSIASKLYHRIWKPVENGLSDANLVFIAPDGALNLVSFAGLTDAEGKYLIESYPIQYLSSGRDLIRLRKLVEPREGLFALGDPDFDASASARLSSNVALAQAQESEASLYTLRNIRSGCEELSKITVLPLPGTRKEIERISDAWKKESKEPCWVFFGTDASEENFKRSAPGNKVIHLATHGYYAQSECRRELPQKKFRMSESFVGENPLLLSGLFLAGANLHGEGADSLGVEDGILTAEEVTGMELDGTRWVVLSACESGLGEVKSGEGVYGLRRAFQMAGARTVISALWPVSDKTTAEMMSYLYGFEENNLALAMQSLAKKKLEELRKRNQPDHPYLWAPFIALGDWR
ncbi:MAG: CHAT domain-containing tetratricopeptide repeat protein [Candidatus Zixiibacteriota bacterium]